MTKISVIIPAYNDLPGVLTTLNSLRALAADNTQVEYLVQDDASPNVLYPALVPAEIASTQRNENNVGFGQNCNTAAKRASGEILFFVNQDVYGAPEFSAGWDAKLYGVFEQDRRIGVVGVRLLFPDGKVQHAGGRFDGALQPFHPCLGWTEVNHPDVMTERDMPWVTGAAFAVRRDVWAGLEGFDPVYVGGYFEDVDFCCRARDEGYRVRYTPAVTLIHSVGGSGGNPHFMKNAQAFHKRWVLPKRVRSDVPVVMEHFWA